MSSMRFIESKHIQLFIDPAKLRAAADCLERKRERLMEAKANRICSQKALPEEDYYLDEMRTLAVEGGGLSLHFRLPEEEQGMKV